MSSNPKNSFVDFATNSLQSNPLEITQITSDVGGALVQGNISLQPVASSSYRDFADSDRINYQTEKIPPSRSAFIIVEMNKLITATKSVGVVRRNIGVVASSPTEDPVLPLSTLPFPLILHTILEHANNQDYDTIISWRHHGRAFQVHDPKRFTDVVMPHFFRQKNYSSFQRQLSLYNFNRITGINHPDNGCYYHEMFLRGLPHLCFQMHRERAKASYKKNVIQTEPDFSSMSIVGLRNNMDTNSLPNFALHNFVRQCHSLPNLECEATSNNDNVTSEKTAETQRRGLLHGCSNRITQYFPDHYSNVSNNVALQDASYSKYLPTCVNSERIQLQAGMQLPIGMGVGSHLETHSVIPVVVPTFPIGYRLELTQNLPYVIGRRIDTTPQGRPANFGIPVSNSTADTTLDIDEDNDLFNFLSDVDLGICSSPKTSQSKLESKNRTDSCCIASTTSTFHSPPTRENMIDASMTMRFDHLSNFTIVTEQSHPAVSQLPVVSNCCQSKGFQFSQDSSHTDYARNQVAKSTHKE